MRNRIGLVTPIAFGLSLATSALASDSPLTPSNSDQAAISRAIERGNLMFELDRAAWVSTDELRVRLPNPQGAGIAGWIVNNVGGHMHSIYYRIIDDRPSAVFVVDSQGRNILAAHVLGAGDDASLTPVETRMIQARRLVLSHPPLPLDRCTDGPMNTIVLPPATPDSPVIVYVMSAQVRSGEYPFGGHYEFEVSPKDQIVSSRKFTKTCLNMDLTQIAKNGQPQGVMVTHVLDAVPTEIHVFMARQISLPVYVATPVALPAKSDAFRVWRVEADRMTLVDTLSLGPDRRP